MITSVLRLSIIFSFLLLVLNTNTYSQDVPPPPPSGPPVPPPHLLAPEEPEIYKVVEHMPRFPGCENEPGSDKEKEKCAKGKMLQYIYKNLKYPAVARENGVQGMVVLQFVITEEGLISDIDVIRDPGAGCGEAAKAVVENMNNLPDRWVPGIQRGIPVKILYTLPVKFKLDGRRIIREHNDKRNNSELIVINNLKEPKSKKIRVFLNYKKIFNLKKDRYETYNLKPGSHELVVSDFGTASRYTDKVFRLNIKKGETVYLIISEDNDKRIRQNKINYKLLEWDPKAAIRIISRIEKM